MSSNHRQRQITKGSIGRSRERPPDRKRERRPAGDRTADLKSTSNNDDGSADNTPRPALQSRRRNEARRLFRQRAVARVHALGGRPVFELVDEIIRNHPELEDEIDGRLDKYADLDPNVLRLLGADHFPERPLYLVRGDR
jgi:hypothetical protein